MTRKRILPIGFITSALLLGCDPGEIPNPDTAEAAPSANLPAPMLAEDDGADEDEDEEPCVVGQLRECDDSGGTQFCDEFEAGPAWGECLSDFDCLPGDMQECVLAESVVCELVDGVPTMPMCPWTPLVLNFAAEQPIEMLASDAAFDIAGVGACLDSDWPSAATPWLAVDLDRNGFIDAGHELFGSGTQLASGGRAEHGFIALAPFDDNHDGRITPADSRFEELLVWRDEDADKLSLPHELASLREAGVLAIELDYAVRSECDARGNCGRERSRFTYVGAGGKPASGEVVDMYLACE